MTEMFFFPIKANWGSGVDFDDSDYGFKEEDKSRIKVTIDL